MPGLDGTGPLGRGPMTGGGRGLCNPGGGFGGRGVGWRRGFRFPLYAEPAAPPFYGGYGPGYTWAHPGASPYAPQMTKEEEADFLKNQAEMLGEQLQGIQKRIEELEKQ